MRGTKRCSTICSSFSSVKDQRLEITKSAPKRYACPLVVTNIKDILSAFLPPSVQLISMTNPPHNLLAFASAKRIVIKPRNNIMKIVAQATRHSSDISSTGIP